jgi:hypothetical protein
MKFRATLALTVSFVTKENTLTDRELGTPAVCMAWRLALASGSRSKLQFEDPVTLVMKLLPNHASNVQVMFNSEGDAITETLS